MSIIDWPDDLPPPYPVERLTVEEYERILAAKVLNPDRNIEFLEGVIVRKVRTTLKHDAAVEKLVAAIQPILPQGWSTRTACGITTRESQPQPDVVIVNDKLQGLASSCRAADVMLVVEVADQTLAYDRRSKARVYARAAIPYYWLFNLLDSQIEVFSNPSGPVPMPGYHEQRIYRTDDRVSVVLGLDDLGAIRVGDVIP